MRSVFDNPFLIATINARTRAMSKFDLDELLELDPEMTRKLYYEVASRYRPGSDMKRIIEFVLNWYEPFHSDAVRGGYKIAIGMAGAEVRKYKLAQLEELDRTRPFVPVWEYEQEM